MHSNRTKIHWALTIFEIIIFILAILSVYLSANSEWFWFLYVAIASCFLYVIIKFFEAYPAAKELLVKEDFAAKISDSAVKYGVEQYFNMQDSVGQAKRNDTTQEAIRSAQKLWLCANSGASYLDPSIYRHWPAIEKKLEEGVELRVVLLDPYSQEKKFRNMTNVGGEQFDSKMNLANLIKLYNRYPNLEIGFAEHGMHATVFATDSCLFFDPYQLGLIGDRIENRSFSLKITPSEPAEGVGLYRLFKSHLDTLWRSSTEFSDWLKKASDKLPDNLPKVKER
ncbi:hypothetical protein [Marinomonas profundimaris]|uniref:Uncharacterized protein n=1 Tax=Marinomonas profundimaris TaxID=1208321 RepID=W1S189_9GAMM|nr:hypothetical protein [Marinomonas profundimaris]ETI60843.1 hypothetical protein D104_08325 [Marinomonas profundimaris]